MRMNLPEMFYGGSLLTLPWVGVGLVHFLSGKDLGSGLQPSWAFLAIAILVASLRIAVFANSDRKSLWRPKVPLSFLVIFFGSLLVVLLSGFGLLVAPSLEPLSSAWWRWGRQIIQLLIMLFFLAWPGLWTRGPDRWRFTLDLLFLGVLGQVIYGVFQEFNFYHPQVWFFQLEHFFTSNPSILSGSNKLYLNNVLQEIPRLRGTMCEPLYLGNFLLMAWPFLLVWRRPMPLRLGLGFVSALLLVLTWSRGAWLGALGQLLGLGLFLIYLKMREQQGGNQWSAKSRVLGSVLAIPLFFLLVNYFANGILLQRLMASFNNQDWSNLTRLYSMKAAWLAFLQSPLVGVGWGQFAFHFPLLVDPMGMQSQFTWPVVNNFPLQILCEAGLVGALFFIGIFIFLIRKSWQHLGGAVVQGPPKHPMVLPAALGVVGVWIQLMTFSQYNLPHIWVGLGLLLAALFDSHQLESPSEKEAGP